jgi:hypothetical protein
MAELVYEGDGFWGDGLSGNGLSGNNVGDLRAVGFGVVRMGVDEVLAEAVRLTNYADDARLSGEGGGGRGGSGGGGGVVGDSVAGGGDVLNEVADAALCVRLLAEARVSMYGCMGRMMRGVAQPAAEEGVLLWRVAVLPAMDRVALDQLPAAMLHCLALDVAAHWLLLRRCGAATDALQQLERTREGVRNLSLWHACGMHRRIGPLI